MNEVMLDGGGRSVVSREGNTVYRPVEPWTSSVHALLKHLEHEGFDGCPRVVGSGYHTDGREMLAYIEGEFVHPSPWNDEAAYAVGQLLKKLHDATRHFSPPENAMWRHSHFRSLRSDHMVFGHGDFTPWNLVSKDGIPFAVIDWETAGPIDAMVELAQVCWLNAQLCDDDVAERAGLAAPEIRANQARLILDAYELPVESRSQFVDLMIDVAICDAAQQAIDAGVTADTHDHEPLWGLAWRTRSAAWMVRNREMLLRVLCSASR